MIRRVVFLDRASLKAKVRTPEGADAYVEYDKTSPEEIVPRLEGADVAIVGAGMAGATRSGSKMLMSATRPWRNSPRSWNPQARAGARVIIRTASSRLKSPRSRTQCASRCV